VSQPVLLQVGCHCGPQPEAGRAAPAGTWRAGPSLSHGPTQAAAAGFRFDLDVIEP
jgi:hypothetical protein